MGFRKGDQVLKSLNRVFLWLVVASIFGIVASSRGVFAQPLPSRIGASSGVERGARTGWPGLAAYAISGGHFPCSGFCSAAMTSFTRIVIVLSFVRNALATNQIPPSQVIVGLALFMTVFVMYPTWEMINEQALQPFMEEEITWEEAWERTKIPLADFMFYQTREKDLALFVNISGMEQPEDRYDVPLYVLVPSYVISELKTAFQMGFILFIPFLIIDMVVASTLMSMGMFMLPPVIISLPFKILLFVLVDGWHWLSSRF